MIEVIPFDEKYLDQFEYNGVEKKLTAGINIKEVIKTYAEIGDAFIGIADNKIIGIGGIYKLWGDVGQAWLFLNQEARAYKKSTMKALKEYTQALILKNYYKQVQILCLEDSFEATNLAEHLGFKKRELWRRFTI